VDSCVPCAAPDHSRNELLNCYGGGFQWGLWHIAVAQADSQGQGQPGHRFPAVGHASMCPSHAVSCLSPTSLLTRCSLLTDACSVLKCLSFWLGVTSSAMVVSSPSGASASGIAATPTQAVIS
jgi:hypothetical protein